MTKNEYKLFLRYLKERGLYKRFVKDCNYNRTRDYGLKEYLLECTGATEGIMNLITWAETILGGRLWNVEYNRYKNFFHVRNFNEIKKFNFKELERQ